jgi:putative transposase
MNTYKRHRFPPDIISYAVWLYYRFNLSHRDIEDLLAEQSHEATRVRERGMRRLKSVRQAQRFLGAHAAVSNLFNLGRHLVRAPHYRDLRVSAFAEWSRAVA